MIRHQSIFGVGKGTRRINFQNGYLTQIIKKSTGIFITLDSSVAYYEFIQIKPELMQKHSMWSETQLPYLLATAEKALIDVLYISTRKNRRFIRIPELRLTPDLINIRTFKQLFNQLPLSTRILNAIQLRAEELGIM